jgi:hypothetical protein
VWPRSPRMAYGGGNGGIRCSPEPLDHRRWTGGVEGGAVEEKVQRSGVDEKRNGAKRGNERRPTPFMVARWRGREEWGRGVRGRHCVEGGNGGEREGPGHDEGQLGRPATTPSRRARAVQLPRDRGGRRGAGDSARGRLTSGARRQWGPVVSGGVREGEEKMR